MKTTIIIALVLLFVLVWGNRVEPFWPEVTEHQVELRGLPPAWEGAEIAFFSDFQVGMWLGNESVLNKVVDTIIERKPQAVLIGGDFIYHPTDDDAEEAKEEWEKDDKRRTEMLVDQVVGLLKPMAEAGIRVFAVLGNHDYSMGHHSAHMVKESAQYLSEELEKIGIRVLHNEAAEVSLDGEPLYFVGLASFYPKLSNVEKAMNSVGSKPRIFFMHNANSLNNTPAEKIQFAIAGHTHGGQIRIPGFPHWSWTSLVPQSPDEVKGDGWIPEYKDSGTNLYVNRGIGFSRLPIRLNCRPELSFFKLRTLK